MIGNIWLFWTPIWRRGCPQKGSKCLICPKWVIVSNLWWEIISLCKFPAFRGLLLEKWIFFYSFWPLGFSKKYRNLCFVLNEWQYKICDQKLYLCASLELAGVFFRRMGNFWPFCLPLTRPLGCPKTGQNMWFDKNKCNNHVPRAILCIYVLCIKF